MAWERRGARLYYYSAIWRGGRVQKIYHGPGVIGELAAGVIDGAKLRRAEQAASLASEKGRLAPVAWAMSTLEDGCKLMLEAALNAGGYHKFNGSWRRRGVRRLEDHSVAQATCRGRDPGPARKGPGW